MERSVDILWDQWKLEAVVTATGWPVVFFLPISEEQKRAAPNGAALNYIEVRGVKKWRL